MTKEQAAQVLLNLIQSVPLKHGDYLTLVQAINVLKTETKPKDPGLESPKLS